MHVAAAMFTPASEIAAATAASAPGVLSTSMTRSTAMPHPTPSCPFRSLTHRLARCGGTACEGDGMTPDAGTAAALVSGLCAWIDRLFPDMDRGERLTRALEERFGGDRRAVTDELCREIEGVAHEFSRHLALEYVPDGSLRPDVEPPGWPPPD